MNIPSGIVGQTIAKTSALIVDTAAGKLSYELIHNGLGCQLGAPLVEYEFGDFFRDDKTNICKGTRGPI